VHGGASSRDDDDEQRLLALLSGVTGSSDTQTSRFKIAGGGAGNLRKKYAIRPRGRPTTRGPPPALPTASANAPQRGKSAPPRTGGFTRENVVDEERRAEAPPRGQRAEGGQPLESLG
jgi:hypothetical protein